MGIRGLMSPQQRMASSGRIISDGRVVILGEMRRLVLCRGISLEEWLLWREVRSGCELVGGDVSLLFPLDMEIVEKTKVY